MSHVEQNDALKDNNKIALQRYNFAIECLGSEPKKVLDCGCGMGYGSFMLMNAGHFVTGIDKSEKAIEYAKINYSSFGNYGVTDIEKISTIEDYDFDAVICLEVLCHLIDPQEFINKLKVEELIISAPIDPDPDDGYFYRLHNLSEREFKSILIDWKIIKEFRQKKYLTIYAKKQ